MKEERKHEALIQKLLAGEISQDELKMLQQLTQKFPEYKEIVDAHHLLSHGRSPFPEAQEEQYNVMRKTVMSKIRSDETKVTHSRFAEMFDNLKMFVLKPEMAVAALTLIIGFLLGKAMPPEQGDSSLNIMNQINLLASENKKLVDVQNSPYTFSNVSFKEVDAKNIALSFDVSTHVDRIVTKEDPLVKEVIAQLLLNPSTAGSELKAITFTESLIDRKIKEALIFSMHKAPMLAVRMKALSSLMKYKNDTQTEDAFLKVLKEEESVPMRLMALDYFVTTGFNPDTLWSVLNQSEVKLKTPVMLRAKKYIQENNYIERN